MASVSSAASKSTSSNRLMLLICMGLVYLIWGSTYFAISIVVKTMPPLLSAGVRFLIAGIILYTTMRLFKTPRPTLRQWGSAGLVGALLLAGGNGTVMYVEQQVPSGLTALLVALVPLWTVLINGVIPGGKRPSLRVSAGVILGFGGVALLALRGGGSGAGLNPIAFLLIGSTFLWAAGSIFGSRANLPASPLMSTAVEMLVGGVVVTIGGFALGEGGAIHLNAISWQSEVGLVYLILIGSLVAYSAYSWLIQNAAPALVSTYAYVNPVIALLLGSVGAVFGGVNERLTSVAIIAAAIIIAAVVLITLPDKQALARMRARIISRPNAAEAAQAEQVAIAAEQP